MNANQFNQVITGVVNEALREGVAKQRMTSLDIAGILSNHVTGVLAMIGQAQQAAMLAQKNGEAKALTDIIIPLPKNLKCAHEHVIGNKCQDCGWELPPSHD